MLDQFEDLLGAPLPAEPPASQMVPAGAGGERAMGAFDGADRYNTSLAAWAPTMGSADLDVIPSKQLSDARVRDMVRNDAYVQGGAQLQKNNIVGSQYLLNSKPSSVAVFGKVDEDFEAAFQEEVEELFHIAADSPKNYFDSAGRNTFTDLVRLATGLHVMTGEVLATVEWKKDGRPFSTAIQMVDTDRLSTPTTFPNIGDQNIRAGIKRDGSGRPISYFIRAGHPNDYYTPFFNMMAQWVEVPVEKPWGRTQVIHIFNQLRPDQTRGIAAMTAALKEMHITHRFRDVTLQNAVTQALYAAAITSDLPSETVFQSLGGGQMTPEAIQKAIGDYAVGYFGTIDEFAGSAKNLHVDGVRIPHLMPGTKLEMISPSSGGPLGMEFEASLLRYIAKTLDVSYEQLSGDYSKTNYSSARAAMVETWKAMQALKIEVADRFATEVFRLWLEEMINADMLKTFPAAKASLLYTNGRQNLAFDGLARCDWIGAARGQIDELKETQADVLKLNNGLITREEVIGKSGKDWRKVFRQLGREKKLADSIGLQFAAADPSMMNAVGGGAQPTNSPNPDGGKVAK
ncbi:phage portal protein [Sphingomonas sp. TREG-RG-20F-R18-01]|uniref:phage portal protein n=1 Tax=Sphingomonas sp. TREG-RG-20F-R18-01 TaxID=2914982 RepID=UPI001F594854|nr:phage portal protein [Sphingomonas sp. TREG-RG-20F-R18-01]